MDLLNIASHLIAFEIDKGFARLLRQEFGERENFGLVEGDVRKTWSSTNQKPEVVLGNLPYVTGSLIIAEFLEGGFTPDLMIYTLQKEVVQRICASPGQEAYGGFSVLCQSWYQAESKGDIPPAAFFPQPDVQSSVLRMSRKEGAWRPSRPKAYAGLIRALFANRRKMVRNNLKAYASSQGLDLARVLDSAEETGLSADSRAEEHAPEVFLSFAQTLGY